MGVGGGGGEEEERGGQATEGHCSPLQLPAKGRAFPLPPHIAPSRPHVHGCWLLHQPTSGALCLQWPHTAQLLVATGVRPSAAGCSPMVMLREMVSGGCAQGRWGCKVRQACRIHMGRCTLWATGGAGRVRRTRADAPCIAWHTDSCSSVCCPWHGKPHLGCRVNQPRNHKPPAAVQAGPQMNCIHDWHAGVPQAHGSPPSSCAALCAQREEAGLAAVSPVGHRPPKVGGFWSCMSHARQPVWCPQ